MSIRDSEHEPDSVRPKHLAGRIRQSVSHFDKRKIVPILGYQLGFRHKRALYDAGVALAVGDDDPHGICYDPDRNRILIVCGTVPARLLIMNPEDMTYTRLTLVGTNCGGYRVAYDGEWYWVTTSVVPLPAEVVRINPDTLAFTILTLPNDGFHLYANALCIAETLAGKRYVFVGLQEETTGADARIIRIDPATFPAYDEINVGTDVMVNVARSRELVFDGTWVWAAHNSGAITRINPDTLAWTRVATGITAAADLYSGCFDGSYLWWAGVGGTLAKFNPATYAHDDYVIDLDGAGAVSTMHSMCFDGRYIHMVNYPTGTYYILDPETMEYVLHEFVGNNMHGVVFDGINIWIVRLVAAGTANTVLRFVAHEHHRRIEQGQTDTFSCAATATITIAVTFKLPFSRTPVVVVSLNDLSNTAVRIQNVEAQNVTTAGFNCRCEVTTAQAAATCRFMWIATERSTHHP